MKNFLLSIAFLSLSVFAQDVKTVKARIHDSLTAGTARPRFYSAVITATDTAAAFKPANGAARLATVDSAQQLDTLTGVDAVVTGTIKCYRIGNVVTVEIPVMTGTSNTTACTISRIPSGFQPASTKRISVVANISDGVAVYSGHVSIATTGIMTLLLAPTAVLAPTATFTNTGTKGWTAVHSFSFPVAP